MIQASNNPIVRTPITVAMLVVQFSKCVLPHGSRQGLRGQFSHARYMSSTTSSSSSSTTSSSSSSSSTSEDVARRKMLEKIIRVDHAGELGASYIYKGAWTGSGYTNISNSSPSPRPDGSAAEPPEGGPPDPGDVGARDGTPAQVRGAAGHLQGPAHHLRAAVESSRLHTRSGL